MSGSKDREHLGCIAEVNVALTTLVPCLRTVRHGDGNCIVQDDVTRDSGDDGVLVLVSLGTVRQWFDMSTFRVLRCMHCNTIFAFLTIARLAKLNGDVSGVERFSFEFARSKFIFYFWFLGLHVNVLPERRLLRGRDEIRPVYREKFAYRSMSCDFTEWA